jgi:hypothetical protein
MIMPSEQYKLYGVSVKEAMEIQDNLLYDLIDKNIYMYREIAHLFSHNVEKISYSVPIQGEYILHKGSVWRCEYEDIPFILPCDVKCIETRDGWKLQDYIDKYPGYIPLNHADLIERINCFLDRYRDINTLALHIQMRPNAYRYIHAGTPLTSDSNLYRRLTTRIFNRDKFPTIWDPILSYVEKQFHTCDEGWETPHTIYTLSFSHVRISPDIDIKCS